MPLTLKRATLHDLPALLDLEETCFTEDRLSKRSYQSLLKKETADIFIATSNKIAVGSAVVFFRKNSKTARLYSLAVKKPYRKQGIAHRLTRLYESKARLRGCQTIVLEVRPDNKAAIQFYLKEGYEPFDRYKRFYEDGADALRMKKLLYVSRKSK